MKKISLVFVLVAVAFALFVCVCDVASVTTREVDDALVEYPDAECTQIQDAVDANSYIDAFIKHSDAKEASEEEWNTIFDKATTDSLTVLTAELDKPEVKRGESVNVSGAASATNVVDIIALGPRGLRKMPASITSEIALADGFLFMTVAVTEDNTFNAEIRIPEEIYSGFHHVMVLSPGEDGVYGATTSTGGELFDAMLDYIAAKGGCEAVLSGKSTKQLSDIIAAATYNTTGSDDLAVNLTFIGASSFGEVMKLNPIAPRHVGVPLDVSGTTELEDGSVVVLSTISGPLYLTPATVPVDAGMLNATFDTSDAVPGTYMMQAEDTEGNIDTESFELLATTILAQVLKKTIKTKSGEIDLETSLTETSELVKVGLVVTGVPGHSISLTVPKNATFPGGKRDNPSTDTIGPAIINDTIDADGKRKYIVFFNNSGVYTITVVDMVVSSTDSVTIQVVESNVCFDLPSCVVSGETMDVKGTTNTGGNLDIVIDDILMADDLLIDQHGEFEFDLNTRKPFPNIGAYTPGVSVIKAYSNCHVADVSVGDHVRIAYKHLEPDGVCAFLFVAPKVTAELNLNSAARGDYITVRGTACGADIVDIVIIGPEGLKKMPGSFMSEDTIVEGLFFTSAEVSRWGEFEKSIRIPEGTDSGDYQLLILTLGRDGLYALTMREEGELFDALRDYGWRTNDFVGRNQAQVRGMLEEVTFTPGSDDIAEILPFEVEYQTWHVDDDLQDHSDADFTKIQDAVNATSDGDVIIVHDGTYVENVKVNKSITIMSTSGAENTIVRAAADPYGCVFRVTANYTNISGFTIKGAGNGAGIYFHYANHSNISNSNISNNQYGIRLLNSPNSNILNNKVLNNSCGISPCYSSSNNITNNTISNNGYGGIYLSSSSNNTVRSNRLLNNTNGIYLCLSSFNNMTENTINSNKRCGIWLDASPNNNIINNIFENNGIIIETLHGLDDLSYFNTHVIKDNTINEKLIYYYKNTHSIKIPEDAGEVILANCSYMTVENINASFGSVGIELAYTNDSIIANNIADSNKEDGMILCRSSNNTLINNINSNSSCGILLWYSSNNTIVNDKSSNNKWGFFIGSSSNNPITNSRISNNEYGIELDESFNNTIYLNDFINNTNNVAWWGSAGNTWNFTSKIAYHYEDVSYTSYLGNYWDDYNGTDTNSDGIGDTPYSIDSDKDNYPLMAPQKNYLKPSEQETFDTGPSETPYPSIMGLHNGTIKPTHDLTVIKMYTYPCAGTGGHSESVVFYNSTTGEEIANGTWGGYKEGDYQYIEFNKEFVLQRGVIYNYTIITGSYPQIIHEPVFTTSDGEITCTKFTDANGRVYYDKIPAIKME